MSIACNPPEKDTSTATISQSTIIYPAAVSKIFEAHGGLDLWQSMRQLSYDIPSEKTTEHQVVDLHDRREYIEGPNFKMGHNGKDLWVLADTSYNGNPKFYKNLMFYFYAMPFVLADPGIIYTPSEPLEFEGKSYPGMKISYKPEIGLSPKDEYFLHFDPADNSMAWLGYTVTYFSGEKSDAIRWIRYNDWQHLEGLLLPKSMQWFKSEEGKLIEPRNTREFENVTISTKAPNDVVFSMPQGAEVIE